MALWIVTNDWLGNANEGAIVKADSKAEAIEAARSALIEAWKSEMAEAHRSRSGGWRIDHARQHLETYRPDSDLNWRAEEITLPHIGEF